METGRSDKRYSWYTTREQIILLAIIVMLVIGTFSGVHSKLVGRLWDAVVTQGAAPADKIFKVKTISSQGQSVPPTTVFVGQDCSRLQLYVGDAVLGELVLEEHSPAGKKQEAFPYPQTWGRVARGKVQGVPQNGMVMKIYRVLLNGVYLVFYDSEGNYVGYWLILWAT